MANEQKPHMPCDDAELAARARAGDESAFAMLIAQSEPMLRAQAAKFRSSGLDAEDLAQEGLLGLLSAVRTFHSQKGAAFRTYATVCVRNRLISAARRFAHTGGEVPIEEAEHSARTLSESDPAAILAEKESVQQLLSNIQKLLSAREYEVLLRHLNGDSYTRIASAMQIAPKAVDNALQRVRRKLQTSRISKIG